jgi:hypothetical protein
MRRLWLILLIGFVALAFGCSSSGDEIELTGDEVVQLVFFYEDD